MKLIFVGTGKATSDSANGITNYCRLMLNELHIQQVEVSYFGFSKTDCGGTADHRYVKRNLLGFCKFTVQVVKEPAAAVYVFQGILFPYFTILMLILVVTRRKYVIFPHGSLSRNALAKKNKYTRKLYYYLIDRWLIKLAKAVFVTQIIEIDEYLHTQMRIETIPPFVDVPVVERLSSFKDKLSILYLGRGDYRGKGIDRTLRFLNSIDQHGDVEKITFAGFTDDGLIRQIRENISPNLKTKLNFPGVVFGIEKQSIFQAHTHFVLFSRSEGLPLSLMEAACSGLFCLYSNETNFDKYNQTLQVGRKVTDFDCANRWLIKTEHSNKPEILARQFFKIETSCKVLIEKLSEVS